MANELIKLTRGVPPTESFPTTQLAECACAALERYGDVVLQYGESRGFAPLRERLAQEANVHPNQIILGQGSLSLLDLLAHQLVRPGDLVYAEEPTYDRALTTLKRSGARVVGIPLENDGLLVDRLEMRLAGGERPVLFYLIPDFQNPSGTVLARAKREQVVELARRYRFWIIEDVPYRKLRYRGEDEPSFLELAPDCVVQMSSFSKLISPGLRVGYVVVPAGLADQVAKMAEDTYINASYLNQAIVNDFMERGWLEPQIAFLKRMYQPRLEAMLSALETSMNGLGSWRRPDGGFFIGLSLGLPVQVQELLARAREAKLVLTDGRGFYGDGGGDAFVRLPFCALTTEEIQTGIDRLAGVVRSLA